MHKGHIYLVGAGPGDPELITIKGLKALREAEVVIYDRLVPAALLKQTPESADKIYVGKGAGWHTLPSDEIRKIMIEKANSGKVVVRLKGGDPFLFSRGGEEAQELRSAGIDFTVVPGVTSALAAPAYAGIPVTHRRYSSSIAIVTGHEDPNKNRKLVDWKKLATAVDTIIILMGRKTLKDIVQQLIKGGRKTHTEVAIIEWGTTKRQRTITGTLANIVHKADLYKVNPPITIVIGKVVKLHRVLHPSRRR